MEKRKKADNKRLFVKGLIFISVLSFFYYFCSRTPFVKTDTVKIDNRQTTASSDTLKPPVPSVYHIVKPNDTFAEILLKHKVDETCINGFYKHFQGAGLSAIYPGDSIVIALREENPLPESVRIFSKNKYCYSLTKRDSSYSAEKAAIVPVRTRCVLKGTINTCLYVDMYDAGAGYNLISRFTDIFAWDIDFFTDPKKGDGFEIIFEKEYVNGKLRGFGSILAAKYVQKSGNVFTAVALRDSTGKQTFYDPEGNSLQKTFLKSPLTYRRISSGFSYNRRHPILGIVRPHLGIDYAAAVGTPVYSAADGTVRFAGRKGGYGKHVRINHGGSIETYYGHLSSIKIRNGQHVKQGQLIGRVGSTGLSTGPHLDYRMKKAGKFVNPLSINFPSRSNVPREEIAHFSSVAGRYLSLFERHDPSNSSYVIDISFPETNLEVAVDNKSPKKNDRKS